MKRQERKNDRTINIYKILTIVLAVVLIVVLIIFGRSWMVQKNAQKEYEKLSAQVNDLQNQVNDNQINIPSASKTLIHSSNPAFKYMVQSFGSIPYFCRSHEPVPS